MAEGSAEEEQSSTAAPASPPADLRILNTQLSSPYQQQHQQQQHQQQHHQQQQQQQQQSRPQLLQQRQHSSMLATAVPPRHSMLPHPMKAEIKSEIETDNSCDVPLNLKNEDSDRSSSGSPEPGSGSLHEHQLMMEGMRNSRKRRRSPSPKNMEHAKRAAVAQAHLNGTMAGMVTLQNLQNLANLQNLPQVASFAAGLQGMSSELTSNQLINAPLNLTVTSPGTVSTTPSCTTAPMATLTQLLSQPQPVAMPQFIMTSGQLVQGIQGAQLIIPTSQGIATQTILTIPVSHVSTSNQIVNLALSNGQVVSTTLANLQSIAQPQGMMNTPTNNAVPTSPSLGPGLGINPAALPHLLGNSSASQQLLSAMQPQQLLQAAQAAQAVQAQAQAVQAAAAQQAQQQAVSQQQQQQQQPLLASSPQQHLHRHGSHINHYAQQQSEKHHRERVEQSSPLNGSAVSAASALNRLAASNGELTITTSHGPASANVKASPSSVHSVKDDDDDNDSSNQQTISEATNNVVDGINLDEIKEFAKAFKMRRLSLGLTQTQVGQSLSVTEGPAYSQSAICSALAFQMYAQQQKMFEKLDITPKSAVKIKPVLESWMKEAEDKFKSGVNHLTDFIGVEPSKKRKRRTSFTPQALELLNSHFDRNTHPSGNEITALAQQLGYDREVIRIWFCNKRQALKNTVRMMSKSMS